MGGGPSALIYSQKYSEEKEKGFSHVYRTPAAMKGLKEYPDENQKTIAEIWANSLKLYGDKPFLYTKDKDGKFQPKTYSQIDETAKAIGSAIVNLNLAPAKKEWKDYALKFVGIFAPNREEWTILDISNALYGNTAVPLYDSHGPENVQYCLKHTNMETCFLVAAKTKTMCEVKDIGSLKNVVILDEYTEEQQKSLENKGLKVYGFAALVEEGKKNIQPPVAVSQDDIFTFSYTSGTTGDPKGVMITNRNLASVVAVLQTHPSIKIVQTDRHMSYLPMAHVFERVNILGVMASGASAWFSVADPKIIKDDLLLIKPTFFASVPRLYNRFYDAINATFNSLTGFKKTLADTAKSTKLSNLANKCWYTHTLWDKAIFNKVKVDRFGGQIRFMITASAPISKEVCDFMKVAVGCPLIEGYGQTESSGASFATHGDDPVAGHVGGPTMNTEFRLMDVPDMNYTSEDKEEDGTECPRGEVCYRGHGIMAGYYKNEEKTNEAIINGWLHSGDIGKILPNGALKLVDRKKNIFKLAQGEYLAPEKIEQTLIRHEGVDQVWLYGDSLQSFAVSIIHPDENFLKKLGKDLGKGEDYAALCADPEINKAFTAALIAFGKKEKLASFEIPKQIYLEKDDFQVLGGMTPSFKLQRNELKKIFQTNIDNLYKQQ